MSDSRQQLILEDTKTGQWIPVQSEAAGDRAARHKGWTVYTIGPRHPATNIAE